MTLRDTIQNWLTRPQSAYFNQPRFNLIRDNLFHSPGFNGSIAPTVPQLPPSTFPKQTITGTLIKIPRTGP